MMFPVISPVSVSWITTWIMLTVRALVCTPSPLEICSFRITVTPAPAEMVVFGGGTTSTGALPLMLRPSSAEPSALLVACAPFAVLVDIATTSCAVTTPLSRFRASTVALLCAVALPAPMDPVVMTCSVPDVARLGTLMRRS